MEYGRQGAGRAAFKGRGDGATEGTGVVWAGWPGYTYGVRAGYGRGVRSMSVHMGGVAGLRRTMIRKQRRGSTTTTTETSWEEAEAGREDLGPSWWLPSKQLSKCAGGRGARPTDAHDDMMLGLGVYLASSVSNSRGMWEVDKIASSPPIVD